MCARYPFNNCSVYVIGIGITLALSCSESLPACDWLLTLANFLSEVLQEGTERNETEQEKETCTAVRVHKYSVLLVRDCDLAHERSRLRASLCIRGPPVLVHVRVHVRVPRGIRTLRPVGRRVRVRVQCSWPTLNKLERVSCLFVF